MIRRCRHITGLLVLGVALAGAAVAQDNTGLDELSRRDQIFGWEAVGRIDIDRGGFCTGVLIATDLVLTAAHCVFGPDGIPIDAGRMTFRAGLAGDRAIAERRVARTVTHADYRPLAGMTAEKLRLDVALLQLEAAIPAAIAAPFAVESPGDGDTVSVVSYGEGREAVLSWQRVCAVLGRREGVIAVDCDVTSGASGAPVLDRSFGRARIIAIISGGYREADAGHVAFGMELPALVAGLKTRLRQGRTLSQSASVTAGPAIRRIGAGAADRDIGARFVRP